jgi:23S rRNA (cytidine1920-2'-O)/16S rRNA (cytidine1409-2'-O)-methyltransferase
MPKKVKKERIDKLLIDLGLAADKSEALRFLMAGLVVVDDHRVDKPGDLVKPDSDIRLKDRVPYVSRGGLKLEKAVKVFNLDFNDKVVIDIGASTGGFTDVALRNGAARVYAVDTGRGQLDPKLVRDSRVTVLDETNFRTVEYDVIGEKADIFVCDVSFISLKMIISSCVQFSQSSRAVFLIKPQFEAKRDEVGKGGIVRDKTVHERVIKEVIDCAEENSFSLMGLCVSPVKGAKGNIEYLVYFLYNDSAESAYDKDIIRQVVYEEYSYNRETTR